MLNAEVMSRIEFTSALSSEFGIAMVYKSDALILRTYKLGEADRIVVFLTRDRGKKRGVAKGARRPRSRYMGALEPMTRGEVAYFEREQRELVQLNYVDVVRSPLLSRSGEALAT